MLDKEPLGLKVLALGINVLILKKPLLADKTNRPIIICLSIFSNNFCFLISIQPNSSIPLITLDKENLAARYSQVELGRAR